jgi:hypothetical protein
VPDPVEIICQLIADLRGKNGELNVRGLYKKVAKTKAKQLSKMHKLPFDEKKFKREAGVMPGIKLWGQKGYSPYEQMRTPSLTVIALEARPIKGSSNQSSTPRGSGSRCASCPTWIRRRRDDCSSRNSPRTRRTGSRSRPGSREGRCGGRRTPRDRRSRWRVGLWCLGLNHGRFGLCSRADTCAELRGRTAGICGSKHS